MNALDSPLYLYCFALSERLTTLAPPLLAVRVRSVAAVAREVLLADFSGPEAEEKARDLAWIGPRALEHNRVVEEVWAQSPVFPVPFGALYSSEAALVRFATVHEGAIRAFLHRVHRAAEWAAKVFLDRERALAHLLFRRGTADETASLSPGARYLRERKAAQAGDGELRRWLEASANEIERSLAEHAPEFRQRRPLETQDQPGLRMIFNWAWLVEKERAGDFAAAAERLHRAYEGRGLALQLSGPLPPYSFVPPLGEVEAPEGNGGTR
ncbi:MAG: GvpL/GvpF family gas vesicle protein [Deltaproteobacteria bacterium]|nr:GvpL/GvpF family gas vesicle protein [Deltaproteobacteria bacterium]